MEKIECTLKGFQETLDGELTLVNYTDASGQVQTVVYDGEKHDLDFHDLLKVFANLVKNLDNELLLIMGKYDKIYEN